MKMTLRIGCLLGIAVVAVWACGFDGTLREYLNVRFWLPFAKSAVHFEKAGVERADAPFAGMTSIDTPSPLASLRAVYQGIADPALKDSLLASARANASLTPREREEVDLIDAKLDMRAGEPAGEVLLNSAKQKLQAFLRNARTPEYLSEARGWLAHIHYRLGEQTEAGKIYLDELNREGSNLSRETILTSLSMTYGQTGGPKLLQDLEEYFDTPEHAAFAIQLLTNPGSQTQPYARIKELLAANAALLQSDSGANALALLSMRNALRMGDPPGALEIAAMIPAGAAIRSEPDFHWMLASARYVSRDYAGAEKPLLDLFASPRSTPEQKAAAAYGLCGVYYKTNNPVEQIRFALWLETAKGGNGIYAGLGELVYWNPSGWDLNTVLDYEAPREALEAFLTKYPNVPDIRLVKYALAVRLSRENRYQEAAAIYDSIHAIRRAPRLRRAASLYREIDRADLSAAERLEAKYRFAEFLSQNSDRIYFNDSLWYGLQNYALRATDDGRLTRYERETLTAAERQLRDDQEEYWRAYRLLQEVVDEAGKTDLGRKAARLAIRCLRKINPRFGRSDEIAAADIRLSLWLR